MNKSNKKSSPKRGGVNGKNPVVKAPVAQARSYRNLGPRTKQYLPNGDIRVSHREYFNDLTSPGASFNVSQYRINPGLANVFPWLSDIAPNWESYSFERLDFHFETESPTSTPGTVLLVIDYDAADDQPSSKSDAMTYRGAVRSAPWTSCCNRSSKEDLHKMKERYIRQGTLAANLDIKTYDVGALYVCTQGQTGVSTLGELYVDYDVVLKTPQKATTPAGSRRIVGGSGLTATDLTGTDPTLTGTLPLTVSGASEITFGAAWEGLVHLLIAGTTLAVPVVTTATTATIANIATTTNAAATAVSLVYRVQATVGQILNLELTSAATVTAANWRFAEYDYALA